jgi:hypothetical protein
MIAQWGRSDNLTLTLANKYDVEDKASGKNVPKALPLEQADFLNCIVYSPNFQAGFNPAKDTVDFPGTAYNYHFQNSLVLYTGKDTTQFTNCIFNKDPQFVNTRLIDDLLRKACPYDFKPDSVSPARNAADLAIAGRFPYDLNGVSRFQDEGPDIGAYEYVKTK